MLIDPTLDAGSNQVIWYAFVESEDPFSPPSEFDPSLLWWMKSCDPLMKAGYPAPDQLIWLSCIKASYFNNLEWRDEECQPANEEQSQTRRDRLLSLEESELRVIPLLLNASLKTHSAILQQLASHDWHVISTSEIGGIPVWMFPEFGREAEGTMTTTTYHRECAEDELRSLRLVFNLDFLPDIELGSDNLSGPLEPTPTPPSLPPEGRVRPLEEPPQPELPKIQTGILTFPGRELKTS